MKERQRLGIIAGGGDLPERLAKHAFEANRDPYLLGIAGFASQELITEYGGDLASIGEIGKQVRLLKSAQCADLVFAGIIRRPDFAKLRLDLKGVSTLPAIVAAAAKGDDALLRAVIAVFETEGFNVIGADDVFGKLLADSGAHGRHSPNQSDLTDIQLAYHAVQRLGELDIGQGAVARDGIILAVEAQEGTDEMLSRCREMPSLTSGRSGVLVKAPKPIQERRIDLPTIGPRTVEHAIDAGLAGIAIEAKGALLVDRDALIAMADAADLFIYGIDAGHRT